ncbi:MAG: hypothetical protein NZ578_12350 [Candidatus Binatia bacterium]|nr:hypothetical protein [Candidatus Binatia bacterium]
MSEKHLEKVARLARVVFVGGAVCCLLVAGYFFYYYSWTQQRCFTSALGPLVSYWVPLGLAVLLLVALRLRPTSQLNLALVLVSTGAAVFLVEFVLLLTQPSSWEGWRNQQRQRAARTLGMDYDTRTLLQVVLDLRQQGVDAVPGVAPIMLLKRQGNDQVRSDLTLNGTEFLPLGGIANKPTVLCNEAGTYVVYDSDERGFHNPVGSWTTGRVDIVALGDSFTQGMCVPSEKNFVALIRQRWPKTLNLGNQGDAPLTMLATLKEYAQPLRPRVVLWFYFENDLLDLRGEKHSSLLLRYIEDDFSQGLFTRQAEIDHALVAYVEREMTKNLERLAELDDSTHATLTWLLTLPLQTIKLGTIRSRLGLVSGEVCEGAVIQDPRAATPEEIALFRTILAKAQETVRAWGGTLYFVFLPAWERYGYPQLKSPNRERVLTVVKELELPFTDLHPIFQAHPDPLSLFPFRVEGHYTEEGHRLVAEEVLRTLEEQLTSAREGEL